MFLSVLFRVEWCYLCERFFVLVLCYDLVYMPQFTMKVMILGMLVCTNLLMSVCIFTVSNSLLM